MLWIQLWVIVLALVVVLAAAYAYHKRTPQTFTSSAVVSLDSALVGSSTQSGTPGISLDTSVLDQPAVEQAAAKALSTSPAAARSAVSGQVPAAGSLEISATANSPSAAASIATAFAQAVVTQMASNLTSYLAKLTSTLTAIRTQINTLTAQANGSSSTSNSTPSALLTALIQLAVNQYTTVQTQITAAQSVPAAASITQAAGAGELSSTSLAVVMAVAAIVGFLVGLGLALLRHWLIGKVISPADVRAHVDPPVLGSMPKLRHSGSLLPAATAPDGSPIVESIRQIRTAALSLLPRDRGGVLVVAGLRIGDGATFVAANLAAASARAQHETIMVSGDVRRPDLNRYFPLADQPGQHRRGRPADPSSTDNGRSGTGGASGSDPDRGDDGATTEGTDRKSRESGRAQAVLGAPVGDSAPEETDVIGLRVLRSLVGVEEGSDALASSHVRDEIDQLRTVADVVVLDSAPVQSVADPIILAGYADAVILVCRSRRSRIRDLVQAADRLDEAGIRSVGIVINGARWRAKAVGTRSSRSRRD